LPKRGLSKKSSTRKTKYGLIISCFVIILAIIIGMLIYQQSTYTKKPSSEYFSIDQENIAAIGKFSITNKTVIIKMIGFYIEATGGDAHMIYINIDGLQISPDSPYFIPGTTSAYCKELKKGDKIFLEFGGFGPTQGYSSVAITMNNTEYFPVKVKVRCLEAEGEITVYVPYDKIQGVLS